MMNYTVGLDIGVASVGSAVVSADYKILESTSNIFSEANPAENELRRNMRQLRRLTRRKHTRLRDFDKLWVQYGFTVPDEVAGNVLELRVKGIREKLTLDEIYIVLRNALKHRGISHVDDVAVLSNRASCCDNSKKESECKYPCEIQYERYLKYGFYRGAHVINRDGEDIMISNVFTMFSYREEIKAILKKQARHHRKLKKDFREEYISIFNRKRAYFEGPGNELSRTDYGKYTTRIDEETGKYITEDNIFEKLVGRCTIYPDERRASSASYTAQEFNLLNDLNNLTVNGRKLSKDEKTRIIEMVQTERTASVSRFIKTVVGEDTVIIEGARVDKNDKKIYHCFEAYNKIRKALNRIHVDYKNTFSIEEMDLIGDILTLNDDKQAIIDSFNRSGLKISDEIINVLVGVRGKNVRLFSKWHSLSEKLMREIIPIMYEEGENQMQILTKMGLFRPSLYSLKGLKYIPDKELLESIYNPVVRKSVHVSIKVINAYIRKYGYPKQIVIEMPRDKNSEERKKFIRKIQRENEKEIKLIEKKIKDKYNIEISPEDYASHKSLALKLKLWNEQKGKCLYSGKDIDVTELIENRLDFEIGYIIPLSISLDDSRNNKVLVYASENLRKGINTPYYYLRSIDREWDYEKYKEYVLSLDLKIKKVLNLLFEKDITKLDVVSGFINRNLNDTAYASSLVLNILQKFFAANEIDTSVSVIRGEFTHQMRANLKLDKSRVESYSHHAVDAMLIALSKMGYDLYHTLQGKVIDFETGEVMDGHRADDMIDDKLYKKLMYEEKWFEIRSNIRVAEQEVKYSHNVDKKMNRGICNQTIRGSREYDGKTYKINKINIYTKEGIETFRRKIDSGKEDDFLMKKNDPRSFNNLMEIYYDYIDSDNPFEEYTRATGEYPRRYSKKNNGPRITNLRYLDGEVRSALDISHKYGHERGSRKVFLESLTPYRMDVYYNNNDGQYYLVGIKHASMRYLHGKGVIEDETYTRILRDEKVLLDTQTVADLDRLGFSYQMSFYENDIILFEKDGSMCERRFLSRASLDRRNYIELKPIEKDKYEKRRFVSLAKTKKIVKINTDILGNKFYVTQEKFPT